MKLLIQRFAKATIDDTTTIFTTTDDDDNKVEVDIEITLSIDTEGRIRVESIAPVFPSWTAKD